MDQANATTLNPDTDIDAAVDGGITSADVLRLLSREYSPVYGGPRNDPTSELVLAILSQHTSDVNSDRASEQLMDQFGSLERIMEADTEEIAQHINVGGLAKIKAPRIKRVLELIWERRGSLDLSFLKEMPLQGAKAWLKDLPGIGPKSAAVILCFSLGMPAMAVDTHVYRVSKRLGLIGSKTSYEDAHEVLERAVAPDQVYAFHVCLITHGRKVCKAPRPLCYGCVLAYGCPSKHLGTNHKVVS